MSSKNKIIRLNLVERVEKLITAGITTSTDISNALKAAGYDVSQSTVSRYLKEVNDTRQTQTKAIINKHVSATLPSDLTALETMEKMCLEWAGEDNDAFAHRLAEQHIENSASSWIDMIMALTTSDILKRKFAISQIIKQCLSWTADDLKLQTARIAAMRQASSIIELKIRHSLGDNTDGKIIFASPERGDKVTRDEKTGNLLFIPGGAE